MEHEQSAMSGSGTTSIRSTRLMTKGEYRVGITFNPSNNTDVDHIKSKAADLIDAIEAIWPESTGDGERESEVEALKALAMREVESAAMWAVKAATKSAQVIVDAILPSPEGR